MLRTISIIACLWLPASAAWAAEAGKIIFVAGAATGGKGAGQLVLGGSVQEGELLTTGVDGYVYIKTIDSGLFILRPNSKARIAAYHVDAVNPANTRIKLELLSGVARSQSGSAVKLARQNFRFNTPVAAIGVRGTDFTVFTDERTSRVAVLSGGITISGFTGACRPEGAGPCEGAASRELSAAQTGQLMQIQRGQAAAQLMPGGVLAPDVLAPPRADEPVGKSAVGTPGTSLPGSVPLLDPIKSVAVLQKAESAAPVVPPPVVVVVVVPPTALPPPVVAPPTALPPPVVMPPVVAPPVTEPVLPPPPERTIVWGRFQPILNQAVQVDLAEQARARAQLIDLKGAYALLRTTDEKEYVIPPRGNVGFALQASEAYISSDNVTVKPIKAQIENGLLNFDFDKRTFATSFDLVDNANRFKLMGTGSVAADGRFGVDDQYAPGNNMSADGVLSNAKGGGAAYLFLGRLIDGRTANGATYWGVR